MINLIIIYNIVIILSIFTNFIMKYSDIQQEQAGQIFFERDLVLDMLNHSYVFELSNAWYIFNLLINW